MYSNLGKIWVGCISGSIKIQVDVYQFHGFRVNPTGLERLLVNFLFGQNQNLSIFIN